MSLEAIYHFVPVSDELATAGQPSDSQLAEIAAAGYQAVINLGLLDPRYCLEDEAARVRELGMSYVHIPVNFQQPQWGDLQAFFGALDELSAKKVFVHCAANYRVSVFVSLYGQFKLGWSAEAADAHVRRLWDPDPVWRNFISHARQQLARQTAC